MADAEGEARRAAEAGPVEEEDSQAEVLAAAADHSEAAGLAAAGSGDLENVSVTKNHKLLVVV